MTGNPAAVAGIDHVVIATSNLPVMLQFYQEVFGCHLERTIPEIGLFQLRAGTAMIDLLDINGRSENRGGTLRNMDHLCLTLKAWDVAALEAHLDRYQVNIGSPESRYGALGFGPSIYLKDPDGNTIELKGPPEDRTFWMDT